MGLPHVIILFGGPFALILLFAWWQSRPPTLAEKRPRDRGLGTIQLGCLVAFTLVAVCAAVGLYLLQHGASP